MKKQPNIQQQGILKLVKHPLLNAFVMDSIILTKQLLIHYNMDKKLLFYQVSSIFNSGKKVLFQIWDTSVNQNFRLILPSLYNSVMGILLVFSVDNRNSFNSIAVWIKQIQTYAPQNIPVILVCNKADLLKKQVTQRQAQALSEAINLDMVMVSARKHINIEQTMIKLYQKRKKAH